MRGKLLLLASLLVCGAVLGVGSSAAADPSGGCTTTAGVTTCDFLYTGASELWTVPAGVTSISIVAKGASGGLVEPDVSACAAYGEGGLGGEASATFNVTPGATLQVNVGGEGGDCTGAGLSSAGGFNGGADGGGGAAPGLGGGGASDVRSGSYTLGDRIIVAGGGGGGAVSADGVSGPSVGGAGGGDTGGDGADGTGGLGGGGGGTGGFGGGTGGAGGSPVGHGGNGTLGFGGYGGNGPAVAGGGGGGGGYYGGGGGGGGIAPVGGGGGGNGFIAAGATNTSMNTGVRAGNGRVTITYTEPAPSIVAPGLEKTAIATHHRKVEWAITKLVDGKTSESFNQATPQTLHYGVALTKTVDYDTYGVTGDITATNTNPDPLQVTITETGLAPAVSGSSCTLDLTGNPTSVAVTLDAGSVATPSTYTVSYTCTFTTAPDPQTEYTNGASVTYDSGNGTDEVDALSDLFTFPAATEDGAPESVTVSDPNAPTAAGFPKTATDSATYTYTQAVFSDPCTQFNNTATITETGQSASTSVAFCGPRGLLNNLLSYVNGLPPGTSLSSKVQTAINYYNAHDIRDTCTALTGVINQAKAVSGKKITKAQANTVIAMAKQIQAVLGC